ncbi:MAG: hypothetical protein PHH84_06860 [Oscillospiraceae bacterium]|nr:hypothetical protein [Oscillospiraceae bacterium]MDD4414829.1 hypothetical protein [Oscillospiraceae bacterium]
MKKIILSLTLMTFIVYSLTLTVMAIGNEPTTSTPTSTTSTTGPTSPTLPGDLDFSINYIDDNNSIEVTWDNQKNPDIIVDSIIIGNKSIGIYDNTGLFQVNIQDELLPGIYNATLIISDSFGNSLSIPTPERIERSGKLNTNITLNEVQERLEATVLDEHMRPIADCEVEYYILNQLIEKLKTDKNGYVKFTKALPVDNDDVLCKIKDYSVYLEMTGREILYVGTESGFPDKIIPTTTTTSAKTTTTKSTTSKTKAPPKITTTQNYTSPPTTTAPTLPIINGAGTTAIRGDQIALNVSFDTGIPKLFDNTPNDFSSRARLLINKNLYSNIIGSSTASLMLLVRTSPHNVTDQHISAAISNKSKYSAYNAEDTLRIPLDLSITMVDKSNGINTQVPIPDSELTIELPVPNSMKDKSKYKIAVALFDSNGIKQVLDTSVDDGVISFKTGKLSQIIILGFQDTSGISNSGGIPIIMLLLIFGGIIMLIVAGLLLYFFFIRKPIAQEETEGIKYFDPDTPYDLPDTDDQNEPQENTDNDSDTGISLGSLINRSEQEDSGD